jgi:hypothetical protein
MIRTELCGWMQFMVATGERKVTKMYRLRIFHASLVMLLVLHQTAYGDSILLDDFSTNLTLGNVRFYALNPDGSINPAGSTSGSSVSTVLQRVQVGSGNMATWSDGTSASPAAGVLGGIRTVEIRNDDLSNQASSFKIFNGVMDVNSPSANVLCLACLTYDFGSAPQDFTIVKKIILDFTSFDQSARNNVRLNVSLYDGYKTAYGVIDTSTATVGSNKFFLTSLTNWGQLNMGSIRSVRLDFTATNPGVDFRLNSVAFTHAPEPSFFGVLAIVIGVAVILKSGKPLCSRLRQPCAAQAV